MFETIDKYAPVYEKPKKAHGLFQKLLNLISWIFLGIFGITLLFTAASNLNLFGSYRSLIVQSGSMEPTIMTGDVIIIGQSPDYVKNDVITFRDEDELITTHRIAEIATTPDRIYITKGDANRVQDDAKVSKEQILGKVILTIPNLGYYIFFVRSKIGLILFVGLPTVLIIVDELMNINKALTKRK